MEIVNKTFIREFHLKRCGNVEITNEQEYESLLYKTLVVNLLMFDDDNWGEFEFTDWIGDINLYELDNNLPSKYSKLRELLESKHQGFYVEPKDFGDCLNDDEYKTPHEPAVELTVELIDTEQDYLYHLHKSIEVMFHGSAQDKEEYNHAKWWKAVGAFETKHNLPNRSSQFYMDERFREMAKFRVGQGLS